MVIEMGYITEKEYKNRMKKIKEKNASKERKLKLREEKNRYGFKFRFPSTSKIVLFIVFSICVEILIFSQYAMIELRDLNAMYALISVPVTLVPIALGYYWKSKNENTTGGITYETAINQMKQLQSDNSNNEETEDLSGVEPVYADSEDAKG